MPVTGFFNNNANRSYPFVGAQPTAAPALPDSTIVDFGCSLGVESGFTEGVDSVYLFGVARVGDFFMFEFRCTDAAMSSHNLIFTRRLTDAENSIEYVDATPVGIPGSSFPASLSFEPTTDERVCAERPVWDGYLVTGDLTDLAALLSANGGIWYAGVVGTDDELISEPALIQDLGKSYLRSVNLANEERTTATPCSVTAAPTLTDREIIVNELCITGPLEFKEGYNCAIAYSVFGNSLTFSAGVAAGAGEPCEEVPLNTDDVILGDSKFLTNGPYCYELISTVNGVTGTGGIPNILTLAGRDGVTVVPTPGMPHSLDVTISLSNFAVCDLPPLESSAVATSSSSSVSSAGSAAGSVSASSESLDCAECGSCDGKGYVDYVQKGWIHSKPYIPELAAVIDGCTHDECWNRCCDGYVPPAVGSLSMSAGSAFYCSEPGVTIARFCCEEAPPTACSSCSSESIGFTLWETDMFAAGWPADKTWVQTPRPADGGTWPVCCDGYAAPRPTPAAEPNYTPSFGTVPGMRYRKECCACADGAFPLPTGGDPGVPSAALEGAGDYACTCSCGWSFWSKDSIATQGPWVMYTSHCLAACADDMPMYTDTGGATVAGAAVVDLGGWGIDSIFVTTCCS
jgi:hypothetical protein